jgi:hypothetical protein
MDIERLSRLAVERCEPPLLRVDGALQALRLPPLAGPVRPAWHGGPARLVGRCARQPVQGCLPASGRVVEGPGSAARQTARHQDGAAR